MQWHRTTSGVSSRHPPDPHSKNGVVPEEIWVNAVAPGPIWTPLQVSNGQPKGELPKSGHNVPLGQAGQPVELAPAYAVLAYAESNYVSGETLNVNGGKYTPGFLNLRRFEVEPHGRANQQTDT